MARGSSTTGQCPSSGKQEEPRHTRLLWNRPQHCACLDFMALTIKEDPMFNSLSSLLKVVKKKKIQPKNTNQTNQSNQQPQNKQKKGWVLRFGRTQSQNYPSGVTSSAFICALLLPKKSMELHPVEAVLRVLATTSPSGNFTLWKKSA